MISPSKILKDASETVVGKDAFDIPIVDCPQFKKGGSPNRWHDCPECGVKNVLTDAYGTYYHKLSCSKSNGIGYACNNEREMNKSHDKLKCRCSYCRGAKGG